MHAGKSADNTLSDILKTPPHQRTQEQVSTLIHWLMGVWEIANTMGFKRCGMMLQAFKYFEYAPGENIIVEGERGLSFYIIISGETSVHKVFLFAICFTLSNYFCAGLGWYWCGSDIG